MMRTPNELAAGTEIHNRQFIGLAETIRRMSLRGQEGVARDMAVDRGVAAMQPALCGWCHRADNDIQIPARAALQTIDFVHKHPPGDAQWSSPDRAERSLSDSAERSLSDRAERSLSDSAERSMKTGGDAGIVASS